MNTHSRLRRFGVTAAATMLLAGLAACSSGPTADQSNGSTDSGAPVVADGVSFSLAPGSLTNVAEYVAIDMGYFAKYGLTNPKVITSTSTATTLQLLQSGQLDFGAGNIPSTILAQQASGTQYRVAVGIMTNEPASLVCRSSVNVSGTYPANMASLKGLNIGLTAPTNTETAEMIASLDEAGMSQSDIKITYIQGGMPPIVAALQAGQIDCAVVYEPTQTELGDTVKTVWDVPTKNAPQLVLDSRFNVLSVTKDYADKNPQIIAAAQHAIADATALLADPANAPKIAAALASRYPDFSSDQLTALIARLAPLSVGGAEVTQSQFDASLKMFDYVNDQPIQANYSDVVLPLSN